MATLPGARDGKAASPASLPDTSPSPSSPASPASPRPPPRDFATSGSPTREQQPLLSTPRAIPSGVGGDDDNMGVADRPLSTPVIEDLDGPKEKASRKRLLLLTIVGGSVLLLTALVVGIALLRRGSSNKRNVILMISDGFGPASETLSRSYYQMVNKLPWDYQMPLDTILVGQSRTLSASSLVTDSAAGATAFSCAKKTYNTGIAVDENGVPCGTVLEAAKAKGMLTGLVATSRITHATPACFSSHVKIRDMENEIARQQVGDYVLHRQVDLMFGGGRCHFLHRSVNGSCRADDENVWKFAQDVGWKFIQSRKEFDELNPKQPQLPLAGLFALDHMSYEIDRNPAEEPSLKEMTTVALSMLQAATDSSDKGFFIMIEGSRIDMAGHTNDPAAHVHDILQYQETIAYVKGWVDSHPGTVMISVSDHETGGLTLARQVTSAYPEYLWYPEVVQRVKKSTDVLARMLISYPNRNTTEFSRFINETVVRDSLGISNPTEDELSFLKNSTIHSALNQWLANMVSVRAELGWTTHGHSGVDVNLYAYGAEAEKLRGSHENTDIGEFIRGYLGLDLDAITQHLKTEEFIRRSEPDMAVVVEEINRDGLQHYHHAHGGVAEL